MYEPRNAKIWKLLNLMAKSEKGEMYQSEMAKKLGCSYRNLIRQLQMLKAAGLIQLARTEPSLKKGKEKHIWALTFSGMIAAFTHALTSFGSMTKDAEKIADMCKGYWLIFQEWSYLTKDPEIKNIILLGIFKYSHLSSLVRKDFQPLAREVKLLIVPDQKQIKQHLQSMEEETLGREITSAALWLDLVLERADVIPLLLLQDQGIGKLWKLAASNQNTRKFIENTFKREHNRHKWISAFQALLLDEKAKP